MLCVEALWTFVEVKFTLVLVTESCTMKQSEKIQLTQYSPRKGNAGKIAYSKRGKSELTPQPTACTSNPSVGGGQRQKGF